MSNESQADQQAILPSGLPENGHGGDLRIQCDGLRRRVQELEAQLEHDQRRIAELEAERDHYRAESLAWARRHFERKGLDLEQVKRQMGQEDGVPLAAFIDELEQISNGK